MRIAELYSHNNGWEYIECHSPEVNLEIQDVILALDISKLHLESRRKNVSLAIRRQFEEKLAARDWRQARIDYYTAADPKLLTRLAEYSPDKQRQEILEAGETPIFSYNQTDFVKDRIALEVQFGKYSFVAYDLFVKHMAFYVGDVIDVGVEILPMKELSAEMSSGVAYYECELYNLIRQGRGVPAVPLVLIGVAP